MQTTECGQALSISYPGLWDVPHPEDCTKCDLEAMNSWNGMEEVLCMEVESELPDLIRLNDECMCTLRLRQRAHDMWQFLTYDILISGRNTAESTSRYQSGLRLMGVS